MSAITDIAMTLQQVSSHYLRLTPFLSFTVIAKPLLHNLLESLQCDKAMPYSLINAHNAIYCGIVPV